MREFMRFLVFAALVAAPIFVSAQAQPMTHVLIQNLAKVSELDFEGGECDRTSDMMVCKFLQVLLTQDQGSDTCRIVTNRYDATFTKQTERRWVSNEGPDGACGVLGITTLEQDPQASGLWTMSLRKVVTNKAANDACQGIDERPEELTWKNSTRPLLCKFVAPALVQ
jgi:hypothetical protein